MSFPNTHTPRMSEISGEAKYQCPMHKVNGADAYYMTPEIEKHFRKLYPITMNRDMMRLFGISFSTVQRFKRQLGLEKKMRTIRRKQAAIAKEINERNGLYERLRGKPLSEACMKASAEKRASGWHPLKGLSHRNNRKYHRIMKKRSENRKELMRKEKMRVEWGMEQHTKLNIPYDPYGRKRSVFKNTCRRVGYIPGNPHKPEERWIIFYTPETKRGAIRESNGEKLGFKFEPLSVSDILLRTAEAMCSAASELTIHLEYESDK